MESMPSIGPSTATTSDIKLASDGRNLDSQRRQAAHNPKAAAKEAEKAAIKAVKDKAKADAAAQVAAAKAAAAAAKPAKGAKAAAKPAAAAAPKPEVKVAASAAASDSAAPESVTGELKLIDGTLYMVKSGNVYEYDELTEKAGDFVGRLTAEETIDTEGAEVTVAESVTE